MATTASIKREEKPDIPEMDGDAGYPRSNGQVVFDEPWQSRIFGLVVSMYNEGEFPWDDFKSRLIEEIGAAPQNEGQEKSEEYYYHFLDAFSRLLLEDRILKLDEIQTRTDEFITGIRREVY